MEAERLLLMDTSPAEPLEIPSRPRLRLVEPPAAEVAEQPVASDGLYRRFGKRALDLTLGLPLLLLATPAITALAAGVVVSSGWPPFYTAKRLGRDGREFSMWKLRTMVPSAEQQLHEWMTSKHDFGSEFANNFKLTKDPRVTGLGRLLRRTSLDELPQLWNVLRGDMSLVGPRPYYDWQVESRPEVLEAVTSVRPGLTGPWQVGGRNDVLPAERMAMDGEYVRDYSLRNDLLLLARTIVPLLKANGR